MALSLKHSSKELPKNPFIDNDFSIDEDGKTLEFYNHNLEKKVYEIHHYGDGNRIYFKKNNKVNNSRYLVI
jgi:hypothetical protein